MMTVVPNQSYASEMIFHDLVIFCVLLYKCIFLSILLLIIKMCFKHIYLLAGSASVIPVLSHISESSPKFRYQKIVSIQSKIILSTVQYIIF